MTGVEVVELLAVRHGRAGEFRQPEEERIDAAVLAEEDRPVQFLEVEDQIERPAHPHVLEERPAEVRHEADHDARHLVERRPLPSSPCPRCIAGKS